MSEFNITVDGGSSVRLPTAEKYVDRDIIVTATGSTQTPENLDDVLTEQETLIATLQETLRGKASGGGSSYGFEWANVYEIEIGENSISNSADTVAYIKTLVNSYSKSVIILMSPLTVNNQMVACGIPLMRWRGGNLMTTTVGTAYDMFIPEGTKYLVLENQG